jgi:hypothetical protein
LKKSLQALSNLQTVRLDRFPGGARDTGVSKEDAWTAAWGAKSVIRKVGLHDFDKWAIRVFVYNDFGNWGKFNEVTDRGLMYGHYDRTLKALSGIADKTWTLEIFLSSNHLWGGKAPIDLASPHWQAVRKRIRALNLADTSIRGRFFEGGPPHPEVFDQDLLKSFVHDCYDLESLTIGTDDNTGWLRRNFQFSKLRHLTIKDNRFLYQYLASFLKGHSGTLESITLGQVYFILSASPGAAVHSRIYQEEPEDMLEDGEDVPRNPNWFAIFKTMLAMPRLNSMQLADLTQYNRQNFQPSVSLKWPKSKTTMHKRGADPSLVATGDEISQQLGNAITQALTNDHFRHYDDISRTGILVSHVLNVWFPAPG